MRVCVRVCTGEGLNTPTAETRIELTTAKLNYKEEDKEK